MSRNERSTSTKGPARTRRCAPRTAADRRVVYTRERLGDALIALVQEKPIDNITVQEVLERAGVGRSTFYVHFRDKDDLLLSQFEAGLEMWSSALSRGRERSNRIAAVAEFFAHAASGKKLYRALVNSDRIHAFFELAEGYFARGIAQRLREIGPSNLEQLDARARAIAGSLLSLLKWWLDRGAKEPPQAMDALFHRLVWDGLS